MSAFVSLINPVPYRFTSEINSAQFNTLRLRCPLQYSRVAAVILPGNLYHSVFSLCASASAPPTKRHTSGIQLRRLGVLVSGGGRSVENLCQAIVNGKLVRCEIAVVIASKNNAGAIERVKPFGVPTHVFRPIDYDKDTARFSDAISTMLDQFSVDFVVMAGWMHFYLIPDRYLSKVLNIHPSLIPSFCGRGYYGSRVHQAVLDFGVKISGCTVHIADNKYDHGPIVLQKAVPVFDSDTVDELAARVFEQEKIALPEAVQLLVDGRIRVENGIVLVMKETCTGQK